MTIKLGLVGLGTIAKAQHLPAIADTDGLQLAAIASRNASAPGLPSYQEIGAMLSAEPELDAVSLCTPPRGRFDQAWTALQAGKHVMLEKPPGATVAEVQGLAGLARQQGRALFATWHSREAVGVDKARDALSSRTLRSARITWKEDVRRWHPGQQWIWEPGGFGVFDPGINALSILTRILPEPVRVESAGLLVPENRAAPIAASVAMRTASNAPVDVELDWRQTGPQTWEIDVETTAGPIRLWEGGHRLSIDGEEIAISADSEYRRLYRRFVELMQRNESDVDLAPLTLVSDAFLVGRLHEVEPFQDAPAS
jgi:D-galactose 1-dehydrogenase